jgi:hypothetical protein
MTTGTITGEATRMNIIFCMTTNARCFGGFVSAACMATFAGHGSMEANQRIGCSVVIKFDVLLPCYDTMATAAFFTQFRLVDVLRSVTINTSNGNFDMNVRTVAIAAHCF